jgi:colanic acid/amylovoran biosynthesis glycosyltransferase
VPDGALTVLTFHRIADPVDGPPGMVSATPAAFERRIRGLAASGRAVSLEAVLAAAAGRGALPRGAVLVTFDDGYRDFAEHAWPVLRRCGVPVALFVPTAFPGAGEAFWWDRLWTALAGERDRPAAYRALRARVKDLPHEEAMALVDAEASARDAPPAEAQVLDWDDLRALRSEGVALAAHSRTHPLLSQVGEQRLRDEIAGSLDDLRRELGSVSPAFAFPGGATGPAAAAALRDAGVVAAFTTRAVVNDLREPDWLALGRFNVGLRSPGPVLRARIALAPRHRAQRRPAPGRPRVAYVMSRFPKLTETFVLAELLAVERRGVMVDVYPLLRRREAVEHPEAQPLAARARYLPFVSRAVLASQVHWLRRRPRRYLGALRAVATGAWGNANFLAGGLATFPKVAHAARLMEADGVAHVHCHFANHPAVAGLVVHRLTGIPFSFTAHGSDLHKDRTMLAKKVAEAAFVATVSEDNRRLIVGDCGERCAPKVHVVRAGIDTAFFAPNGRHRPAATSLAVLCVGTLHTVKGQAHLIEACRLLVRDGVDVTCRMVGDGPDRAALAERIGRAGLGDRIALAGARTRAEVAAELRTATVLAAPSVPTRDGRREGIPVALMEAMSAGLPVVASRLSGIPELVEEGVTGLLVPPGDPAALAAALERLARDPVLRERLGRAARKRVVREFSVARSSGELVRHFAVETGP